MRTVARLETRRPETRRRPGKRAQMFLASLRKTAMMLESHIVAEECLHSLRDPANASTSLAVRSMRRRLKSLRGTIQRVEAALDRRVRAA